MAKKTIAIVLDENDIQVVQELAEMYTSSFSEAVRMIIREWARTAPTYGKVMIIGGNGQPEK